MTATDLSQVIWLTRGRTWGFRFLLDGGLADPLITYEDAIGELGDETYGIVQRNGCTALRFGDPESRRDASGRLIPHDFVVTGEIGATIASVDDFIDRVWPLVAGAYASVWQTAQPDDLRPLLTN